jgi:putative oxidoreductase
MLDRLKSPLTVAGRVLLALLFVLAGTSKLTQLDATARYIAAGGLPMPELLAVAVGVFELVGGLALALGFMARWAALALGGFSLVAALLFHRFWDMPAACSRWRRGAPVRGAWTRAAHALVLDAAPAPLSH